MEKVVVPGRWSGRYLGTVAEESMMCSRNISKARRASCKELVRREAGRRSRPRRPVFILRATGSYGRVLSAGCYFTSSESSSSGSVLRKARSHLSGRTYRDVCM